MTEESFKIHFAYLQKMYGKELDIEVMKLYHDQLINYPEEKFHQMVESVVRSFIPTSQVPFPLLPHFLQSIGADTKNLGQLAVSVVRETARNCGNWASVSFGDRALHATIERFGGWIKICEWSDQDWNFNEKRFILCYEAEKLSGMNTGPDRLIGVFEEKNREKEYLFSETQLKYAQKTYKTAEIEWQGFEHRLELPSPEEKKRIENIQF